MIPLLTALNVKLAREKAVARWLIDEGYHVWELVEVRFNRVSRRAKRKHMIEVNALPGKVIALIPEIALEDMGDIPYVRGIVKNGHGEALRIPEPQIAQFAENLSALNSGEWAGLIAEAERENQARGKKKRVWVKLNELKEKMGNTYGS